VTTVKTEGESACTLSLSNWLWIALAC
jgi:hypothetical protein